MSGTDDSASEPSSTATNISRVSADNPCLQCTYEANLTPIGTWGGARGEDTAGRTRRRASQDSVSFSSVTSGFCSLVDKATAWLDRHATEDEQRMGTSMLVGGGARSPNGSTRKDVKVD
ncbi:hypothetical protein TSOC_007714 [Tetrabaena socialis]|uniref:Uncharacterized protein n=1 Tax=Tetrabaena socialis TaxID=47790 RepID=A0A2J8A0B4_9CHLO|nr:hypothetical protein TSOC_007714 [Tetrabaena socialis]|eukprot:PNH05960.1 hypothetical protein TSOC_007714 [Tetrabaena socialis]